MRILVTGARGQLGLACLEALPAAGHDVIGVDVPDGDLTDPGTAERLLDRHAPDRVIHAAAYTAVDRAEAERDTAMEVNAAATALMADACRKRGCALTYMSTDYVFSGDCSEGYREDARLDPVNWYGRTKALGEGFVVGLAGACPWQIVRTSWLFGYGPRNFVRAILGRLEQGGVLQVVDDQRGCPTFAPDLALILEGLAVSNAVGIFHAVNRGATTWYDFAREIARMSGHDPARVHRCTTAEYPGAARRPACSVLLDTRLKSLDLPLLPPWRDALARYLRRLEARRAEGAL